MLDLEEHNEERINDVVSQKAATLMRFRRKYGYGYDNQWATLPSLIIQLDDDPEHADLGDVLSILAVCFRSMRLSRNHPEKTES